jgi:hypothetical protein
MTVARIQARGWWAQLRTGLPPAQVRAILAVVACAIAGFLAGLLSDRAYDVVTAIVIAWLLWDRAQLADRCDKATDDADRALGGVQAVVDHLSENGPVSTGRHARRGTR